MNAQTDSSIRVNIKILASWIFAIFWSSLANSASAPMSFLMKAPTQPRGALSVLLESFTPIIEQRPYRSDNGTNLTNLGSRFSLTVGYPTVSDVGSYPDRERSGSRRQPQLLHESNQKYPPTATPSYTAVFWLCQEGRWHHPT